MIDLLPDDLVLFLRSGQQPQYDADSCEAGNVRLHALHQLVVEYFPMDPTDDDDPHAGENGSYLVKGVSLVASCDDYDPEGLLLWLPLDRRYGIWDGEHGTLMVFSPTVSWTQIASDLPRYINAGWAIDGSEPVAPLSAWDRHPHNAEELSWSLPDVEEWYEAGWTHYRNGAEGAIRVERNLGRTTVTGTIFTKREAEQVSETRSLTADEWNRLQPSLNSGFWNQPESSGTIAREPVIMWSISGFRENRYRSIFRDLGGLSAGTDPVYELGRQLMKIAGIDESLLDE